MDIGKNIRKFRIAAGLTQKELAQKCECATGTIQQYELGKRQPRMSQLFNISYELRVPVSSLIDGTDPHSTFVNEFSKKETLRLQYFKSLGYNIKLVEGNSFEIYTSGYKYFIYDDPVDPVGYYDMIVEVVDSAAENIIDQIIDEYADSEKEIDTADYLSETSACEKSSSFSESGNLKQFELIYKSLNNTGQEILDVVSNALIHENKYQGTISTELLKFLPELKMFSKDSATSNLAPLAAHARTDVTQTPEGTQHNLDIMNDDSMRDKE